MTGKMSVIGVSENRVTAVTRLKQLLQTEYFALAYPQLANGLQLRIRLQITFDRKRIREVCPFTKIQS
jgi:hypothetical protein